MAIIFDETGRPIKADNPFPVSVTGSSVTVGADTFELDGRVIHGLAADRPTAADAHAVLPFAYYNAVDTQVLSQTDGTDWQVV